MNNKRQKNIVYGYNSIETIPYSDTNLGKNEFIKNSTTINNAFRQLLDNDLYIENELNKVENNVVGPKGDDTDQTVKNSSDGYKFWGGVADVDDLSVLHKIESQPRDSVARLSEESVRFTFGHGSVMFVASDRLRISEDGENFRELGKITANGYYSDDRNVMFAADDGIYVLTTTVVGFGMPTYGIAKVNRNSIGRVTTVEFDEGGHRIVAGTDRGIYIGEIPDGNANLNENITFYKKRIDEVRVNDIQIMDSGKVQIVATNSGMYGSVDCVGFQHIQDFNIGEGIMCRCSAQFGGDTYFGMSDGLYRLVDGGIVKLFDTGKPIVSLSVNESQMFFSTESTIYSIDNLKTVLEYRTVGPTIKKIQRVVVGGGGCVFILTEDSLKLILDDDIDTVIPIELVDKPRINDFIVKTGVRNVMFVQTQDDVRMLDIDRIYTYESDIPVKVDGYTENPYINAYLVDRDEFIGMLESDNGLFVVTKKCLANVVNPDFHYDIPASFGDIIKCQFIENGNGLRYLIVCENGVILLNSSLTPMWNVGAGVNEKFVGGYCGTNFMVLFVKDTDKNRAVTYAFPGNIRELGSVEMLSGVVGRDVVESSASIFFTIDKQLMYADKRNVFDRIKEETGVVSFGMGDATAPDATYPAILKQGHNFVSIDIVVGVSNETDDGGDTAYTLSTQTLSVGGSDVHINGMLFEGNTLYSLTENGVTETPIQQYEQEFETSDQTTYLSGKSICGGVLLTSDRHGFKSDTYMFVDDMTDIHLRYTEPYNEVVTDVSVDIGSVLSDAESENVPVFVYSTGEGVYIRSGSGKFIQVKVSGVTQMLMTDNGLLVQNPSGVYEISKSRNTYTALSVGDLQGFGAGMIFNSAVETPEYKSQDIIIASSTGLKRYVYDGVNVSITDVGNELSPNIVSISKISDNKFVVNHGSGYSVCEVKPSGRVASAYYKYPDGVNNAVFFSNHGNRVLILPSGNAYKLFRDSTDSSFDKDVGIDIVGYCDTEEDTFYATKTEIMNSSGETVYFGGSDIKNVFAAATDRGTDVWFLDSGALRHVVTSWRTKPSVCSGVSNIWYDNGFIFFLKRDDSTGMDNLYLRSFDSMSADNIGEYFDTHDKVPLFSDSNIRNVTFTNDESNTRVYILTDTSLHTWTYESDARDTEDAIGDKRDYRRINLGNITGNARRFVDGRVVVSRDGSDVDITDIVFHTVSGGSTFVNHGIFLCDDGFYQMQDEACVVGDAVAMKGQDSVTTLMTIDGVITFGTDKKGQGGVYDIKTQDESYGVLSHDFGGNTAYTRSVKSMFMSNGVPYIKNTRSWKMFSAGIFQTVPVLDELDADSSIVGISDGGGTPFVTTKNRIYTLSRKTQYGIDLNQSSIHNCPAHPVRIIDDTSMIRVLASDGSDLLSEYSAYNGVDGVTFRMTGMPMSHEVAYVNGTATSGEKFTRDDSGYHVVYNDTEVQECPSVDLGNIRTIVKHNGLYIVGLSDEMFSFDGIGDDVAYDRITNTEGISFHKIVSASDTQYLICSTNGLYTYYTQTGMMVKNNAGQNDDIRALVAYRLSDYDPQSYICGSASGDVLTSTNHKKWVSFVSIPDAAITDVYVRNSKQYYIGTDKGLYHTAYKYQLVNDIPMYTMENASELYNSMYDALSAMVHQVIMEHIDESHGPSSFIGYVNDTMLSTDFSPISDFYNESVLCSDGELCACNDLVAEMHTSDVADGSITISVSNFLSSYQVADFSYVMKRYTSGMTEIFIYIPTTNTYYLPHVDGSSYCTVSKDIAIKRKNLGSFEIGKQSVKSTTEGNYTDIVVSLDSSRYHIDSVMDIEINGNSLPLKIYKDIEYAKVDGDAVFMFHSRIYPSVVRKYDISRTDGSGYYNFKFSCFGSDAQAIRICFYDSTKNDK